jgi:hypothetical protein
VADRVMLTARRDSITKTRTLERADADAEAERLRADGWTVSIGPPRPNRSIERSKKQRAMVIAAHRSGRRARRDADDAATATDVRRKPGTS